MNREAIFSAVAALIQPMQTDGTLKVFSRILKHWSDCPAEEQPAIYMAQGAQNRVIKSRDLPYGWDFKVSLYIYVCVQEKEVPATVLNPILDRLESIFRQGPAMYKQTLGGLCEACFIDGTIETFEGTLGTQEVAIVPLTIAVR